jgi:fluoroquinolone resistance protein
VNFTRRSYHQEKFARLSLSSEIIKLRLFEECEFANCNFVECKFEGCKFVDCKFYNCILSSIKPMSCQFRDVTFAHSKVIGIDWTIATQVEDLEFVECQINYSNFRFLKLPGIKIVKCEAKEADFTEADLSHGQFESTDFENTRFFKTNLSGADFTGARNYSIDTRNNILEKARFSLPEALSLLGCLNIVID